MVIEDLYCNSENKIEFFSNIKIKELSGLEKSILGIYNFIGNSDNSVFDVSFMMRIPIQIIYYRYKFLINNCSKNSSWV